MVQRNEYGVPGFLETTSDWANRVDRTLDLLAASETPWGDRISRFSYSARFITAFLVTNLTLCLPLWRLGSPEVALTIVLALYLLLLIFLIWSLAMRFHDIGLSGWNALWHLVPLVNVVALLYALLAPGTLGRNQYGSDPILRHRMGRMAYFANVGLLALPGGLFWGVCMYEFMISGENWRDPVTRAMGVFLVWVNLLLAFYAQSCLTMRFHDLGVSRENEFWPYIPVLNIGVLFYLFFAPGTAGPNRYGPEPRKRRKSAPEVLVPSAGDRSEADLGLDNPAARKGNETGNKQPQDQYFESMKLQECRVEEETSMVSTSKPDYKNEFAPLSHKHIENGGQTVGARSTEPEMAPDTASTRQEYDKREIGADIFSIGPAFTPVPGQTLSRSRRATWVRTIRTLVLVVGFMAGAVWCWREYVREDLLVVWNLSDGSELSLKIPITEVTGRFNLRLLGDSESDRLTGPAIYSADKQHYYRANGMLARDSRDLPLAQYEQVKLWLHRRRLIFGSIGGACSVLAFLVMLLFFWRPSHEIGGKGEFTW